MLFRNNGWGAVPGSRAGFTLIEVMVVLALIGAVMVAVAPRLMDKQSAMKKAVRDLATVIRQVHNNARLFNSTHRIVVRLHDKKPHEYFVEAAPGNVMLMTEEQEEELEKLTSFDKEKAAQEKNGGFTEDKRIREVDFPAELPSGLYFGDIEYGNREEAIDAGEAYIHFFPQGLTEEAIIHLTDRKTLNWTIAIHPITGRVNIYDRRITKAELRDQ